MCRLVTVSSLLLLFTFPELPVLHILLVVLHCQVCLLVEARNTLSNIRQKKKLTMSCASWLGPFHISVTAIPAKTEAYLSSWGTIITNLAWKYNLCGSGHTPTKWFMGTQPTWINTAVCTEPAAVKSRLLLPELPAVQAYSRTRSTRSPSYLYNLYRLCWNKKFKLKRLPVLY